MSRVGKSEREKERVGGGSERLQWGGGQENNIFGFEGSQSVPVSPSGRDKVCVQD
jgi:hypothetical protein